MVWTAALALILAGDPHSESAQKPWEADPIIAPDFWFRTEDGVYSVYNKEVKLDRGSVVLWLHGEHSKYPRIPYRTSLWHVRLFCNDSITITASTTFRADGTTLYNWDGVGQVTSIRPGTMYESLQTTYCPK